MKRFQLETKTLVAFMHDIRVRCPQCEQRADIVMKETLRLSCLVCGLVRTYTGIGFRMGGARSILSFGYRFICRQIAVVTSFGLTT